MIPEQLLDRAARRFRVLGDASRLAIVRALMLRGESTVGELVHFTGMGQANVSKHLRLLHDARVLRRRQDGNTVYYDIDDPSIEHMCELVCGRLRDETLADAAVFVADGGS